MNRPATITAIALLLAASRALALDLRLEQLAPLVDGALPVEQVRPVIRPRQAADGKLIFELQTSFSCPVDTRPERVVVSISHSLAAATGPELSSPQRIRLEVPVRQLRMLAPTALCASARTELTRLPEMLTAFGSLVCGDGSGNQRSVSTSLPLDIWLLCPAGDQPEDPVP